MRPDDGLGRDRAARGAEGERKSSQAKGPDSDGTPKSAVSRPRAEGATCVMRYAEAGKLSGHKTEAQSSKGDFVPFFYSAFSLF